jgi:hypothetical protein
LFIFCKKYINKYFGNPVVSKYNGSCQSKLFFIHIANHLFNKRWSREEGELILKYSLAHACPSVSSIMLPSVEV